MNPNHIHYVWLRGLELEGRWPHDVGAWPVTVRRLEMGWGLPNPIHCPEIPIHKDRPLPPSPAIEQSLLRPNRIDCYYRIRTATQCLLFLQKKGGAGVGVEIFPQWGVTRTGRIQNPPLGTQPTGSHFIVLAEFDQKSREFVFPNSWGNEWGKNGWGFLPFDYFDHWQIESWGFERYNSQSPRHTCPGRGEVQLTYSTVSTAIERPAIVFEVYDHDRDERLGWAIVVVVGGFHDLEELYVRPEFRGLGYGRRLATEIRKLSSTRGWRLRAWIPFADSLREHPENRTRLLKTIKNLGLKFVASPERWAAYLATQDGTSPEPIEPAHFPARVKSTHEEQLQQYILTKNAELYRRLAK